MKKKAILEHPDIHVFLISSAFPKLTAILSNFRNFVHGGVLKSKTQLQREE